MERHQEQHAGPLSPNPVRAFPLQSLSDLQAGEGLASATGHDESASVMACEACEHGFESVGLVRAQPLLRVQVQLDLDSHVPRAGDAPVDWAGGDVCQPDPRPAALLQELPRHHHALDLVRPLVDLGDRGAAGSFRR